MIERIVCSDQAPKAIGPYSQAIVSNGFLFVSGQIPLDPLSGEVFRGSIDEQVELSIRNIASILGAAGLSLDDVVKTTIFLKNLANFDAVNRVYSEFFAAAMPARSTVEVTGLPKGVEVEIEAIAAFPPR